VRANSHHDVERHFDWLKDIAEAGAKMSRTKVQVGIDTDCHEIIPNLPLSKMVFQQMKKVGAPQFDAADVDLARQLQTSLRADFGLKDPQALHDKIEDFPAAPYQDAGSTDVGDISWHVPTSGVSTACFRGGKPGP
jgi:aminobenzoyl-glutamate utilization protein B